MAYAYISSQNIQAKPVLNYVWDTGTMSWVVETQGAGGGGGGGDASAALQTTGNASLASIDVSGGNTAGNTSTIQSILQRTNSVLSFANVTALFTGNTLVVTPQSGTRLILTYVSYNPQAPVVVGFRFTTGGNLFLYNELQAGGSIVAKDFGTYRWQGGINESLYVSLNADVETYVNVFYYEE